MFWPYANGVTRTFKNITTKHTNHTKQHEQEKSQLSYADREAPIGVDFFFIKKLPFGSLAKD
jgi:hypothetical protein